MEENKMNDLISRHEVMGELEKVTFTIRHPILGFDMQMINAERSEE